MARAALDLAVRAHLWTTCLDLRYSSICTNPINQHRQEWVVTV